MTRTSMPCALESVKRSTASPSAVRPNGERFTAATSARTAAAQSLDTASHADEVRDLDRLLLVDAVANRNANEARHRAGARIGQPHVVGRVGLPENQIAHPIVAAAVAFEHLRHRHLGPLAEALRDVDLVAV